MKKTSKKEASLVLQDKIKSLIIKQNLKSGDLMPTENELIEQLGVSGFSIGNILASQVIPWVSQTYGWRMAFFIGLAPVALVLYVRRHAPESEEWAQAKAAGKVNKVPLTDLFTKKQLPITLII